MFRERLSYKIIVPGVLITIFAIVVGSLILYLYMRTNIYRVSSERVSTTAELIKKNIERTMLEGKAEVTARLVDDMKTIKGIEQIEVFNHEGREAFKKGALPVEYETIKNLKPGEVFTIRSKDRIVTYVPLENFPSCQACHPSQLKILGAVKVSHVTKGEESRLKGLLITLIILGFIATILLALLFYLILSKKVITPIKLLKKASDDMAGGGFLLIFLSLERRNRRPHFFSERGTQGYKRDTFKGKGSSE
jgi:hypothetical protein